MKEFTLPNLPYDYGALEPYIDEATLKIHHDKHHKVYCDKFNAALKSVEVKTENILEIFSKISNYPTAVRNHGGGFWNHNFYFESMTGEFKEASEFNKIFSAIESSFGSFENFKKEFSDSASALFGSGWTWLGKREDGSLVIFNTANQDNSYMDVVEENAVPILVIDVWEHAYYLKYQNRRQEYIENFFKVIDWEKINERFEEEGG